MRCFRCKLTVAETPGIEFKERSTEFTQALQVMPVTLNVLGSKATLLSESAISSYSTFQFNYLFNYLGA